MEGRPLATPEQRVALERELAETAATIRDEPLRRHYRAEFGGTAESALRSSRWPGTARAVR